MAEKSMLKEKVNVEILNKMANRIQFLYDKLMPYVRIKLAEFYGAQEIDEASKRYLDDPQKPIPMYLLGQLVDSWLMIG